MIIVIRYCSENITFIEAVEKFKKKCNEWKSTETVALYAEFICSTFLQANSSMTLNISSSMVGRVEAMLQDIAADEHGVISPRRKMSFREYEESLDHLNGQKISADMFDFIVEDLKKGVLVDIFLRFRKSDLYRTMLKNRKQSLRKFSSAKF